MPIAVPSPCSKARASSRLGGSHALPKGFGSLPHAPSLSLSQVNTKSYAPGPGVKLPAARPARAGFVTRAAQAQCSASSAGAGCSHQPLRVVAGTLPACAACDHGIAQPSGPGRGGVRRGDRGRGGPGLDLSARAGGQ
jgi:hypothetical protein